MNYQNVDSVCKRKTLGIYFYIFPLTFLLNSCFSNCNEINLSMDDKSWIKCYSNVDTLIFTSNHGNVETFVLKEKYNAHTTCSKFELGPDVYNYIGINYIRSKKSGNTAQHIYLGIDKDLNHGEGVECVKSFQIYDLNASFDGLNKKNLTIKWVEFPNVSKHKIKAMYFQKGDAFTTDAESVNSFLWSKKYGLLQYELWSGEVYLLTKRT